MLAAHDRLPTIPFAEPPGIERREVCVTNGLTPGPDCPYRRTELYLAENPVRPIEAEYTRSDGQIVWRAPAELRDWARQNNVLFIVSSDSLDADSRGSAQMTGSISAHTAPANTAGGCRCPRLSASTTSVILTSPAPGTHARLDPHLPLDTQQIEVSALVADEANVECVEFRVDGKVWATVSAAPYRAWWTLAAGEHRLVAVAINRQGQRWSSEPVTVVVE
jgi:hypothetical protein